MKTSAAGIEFIKQREGVRYSAYLDGGGVPTVGVGHTGPDVEMGMTIDDAEVDRLLAMDLEGAETCVNTHCDAELLQGQFDSLVSLVFNIGCGAFTGSTLLRLLNIGNKAAAAAQFQRWCKDNGKEVPGLLARRKAEAAMFMEA